MYRSGNPFGMLAGAGVLGIILMLVAFILSIVVFVKFARTEEDLVKKAGWSWRHFFSFDRLMLSGILKYLYILSAFEIVALGLMIWFGSASLGVGPFFAGLVGAIIFIAFSELICRVTFEFLMLTIKITENTADIKKAVCGGSVENSTAVQQPGSQAQAAAPLPAYQAHVAAPVAQAAPAKPATWACPKCGRANNKGSFCAGCGTPRAN